MPDESYLRSILKSLVPPQQYNSVGRLSQVEDGGAAYISPEGELLDIPQDFAYQPQTGQVFEAARDPWERMTFLPVGRNRNTLEWSVAMPDIIQRARVAGQRVAERSKEGLTTIPSNVQRDINAIGGLALSTLPIEASIISRIRTPPRTPPTPPTTPINSNYRTRPINEYITPPRVPSGGVQTNINPRTRINETYNPAFSPYTPGSNTGFMPTTRDIVQSGTIRNRDTLEAVLRMLGRETYSTPANMNIQGIRPIK